VFLLWISISRLISWGSSSPWNNASFGMPALGTISNQTHFMGNPGRNEAYLSGCKCISSKRRFRFGPAHGRIDLQLALLSTATLENFVLSSSFVFFVLPFPNVQEDEIYGLQHGFC